MNAYEQLIETFPGATFIGKDHLDGIPGLLLDNGWISEGEKIQLIEKPGEGNMNFVLRVKTDKKSVIIKQSRPWVEKYPDIEAPVERVEVEALFYQMLKQNPFYHRYTPALIGYDRENYLLALEDLGQSADYTFMYRKNQMLDEKSIMGLMEFISHLHTEKWRIEKSVFPSNQQLKKLNHEHIFFFPYLEDNGFDLDQIQLGLQDVARPFKAHDALKAKIADLGKIYLGQGSVLIHGDYYPGSWLKSPDGVRVIDPEFAFFGYPEFDIGIMVAHMKMSGMEKDHIRRALSQYKKPRNFDVALFGSFCAVEILRRIIGLAQLPLDLTLEEKNDLLEWAAGQLLAPDLNPYF